MEVTIMKVEQSINISAAPEKIWPFLTDPAKLPMWFDTFKQCRFSGDTSTGVGTTYYIEEKVPGPLRKIDFKATVWDEPNNLCLKMTSGKNVTDYRIHFRLEPTPGGTLFYFKEEIGMPFGIIGRLLGVLGQKTAEKMVGCMLQELKALAEQ
jgi:carbon monoxide dehydrogenase subunit G